MKPPLKTKAMLFGAYFSSTHGYLSTERSNAIHISQPSAVGKFVHKWGAQCGECFKWRLISTIEEYEEIRSNIIENPFVCNRKAGVSCEDPPDIEYDSSRTWVIDRPSIPITPKGFTREVVMRNDMERMDCYYKGPNGVRFRAMTDFRRFLEKNPEYRGVLSESDFSFLLPKIMVDTVPGNIQVEE